MQSKILIKIIKMLLFALLIIKFELAWCLPFSDPDKKANAELQLYVDNSFYLMDKNLVYSGYKFKNDDNKLILLYRDKEVPVAQFYLNSIGPNEAKKLFITLKNTLKNSNIYLNDNILKQKTDKVGVALIDLYQKEGNYRLKLIDSQRKSSLNYFFSLNGDTKLLCSGITNFNCHKEYY